YWAAHHRAHGKRGPRRDAHDGYVAAALGDDLAALHAEVDQHMLRGARQTEQFLGAPQPAHPQTRSPPES
ncbi:MAG: hypothetical protein M3Y32_08425, partial [Pseudomonadota bacterium]|nr:hypothetical protein [Pseudomonadota bacterium]